MLNATRQAILLSFLLMSLGSLGWYFASSSTVPVLDDKTLAAMPDMFVSQLVVRQFDVNGKLINKLESPSMQHLPQGNVHMLKTPHIIIAQENQSVWSISAKNAIAYQGGEKIKLLNDVVVHQDGGADNQDSTLRTEEIMYYPKTKQAVTSLFVKFEQQGTIIESMGMRADLAQRNVELLSNAKGIYEPKHG